MKINITGERIPYEGKYISVREIYIKNDAGKSGVWEAVKRKTFGKIVSIFALTKDREVILEKIFRVPFNSYVLELPAGLMDKEGENPAETIKRELLEETGYTFEGNPELILEGPFNPGLLKDEMMMFFAKNAEKVSEPDLEPFEDITVIKVPLNDLADMIIDTPDGFLADIKILSILLVLQKRGLV